MPDLPRLLPGFAGPLPRLVSAPRDRLVAGMRAMLSGDATGSPDWVRDLEHGDDEGYFGPGSAVWTVHGDLATLVGGIRALLLQALHPVALAGVTQHSNYREDPLGRLAGTSRWLTVTTFGCRAQADRESARVRGIHRRVRGTYPGPDGAQLAYRADDDRLLTWVHVAFADSLLACYQAFGSSGPIPGGPDAYVREWATAGRLVGVGAPPRSAAELRRQIDGYLPELACSGTTAQIVGFLKDPPLPAPARPAYQVLFAAAASTLDDEHRELLRLPRTGRRVPQTAGRALLAALRTVLGQGPPAAAAARRRLARTA